MNGKTEPFEAHSDRYEAWFERHPEAYASELEAVRELWPRRGTSIEIGVGAGHFAFPLGIGTGIDPTPAMRQRASERGIAVQDGKAEHLPLEDRTFDAALMVTTICFVENPEQSLRELFRILRPGGCAVLGFVDRESPLGKEYQQKKSASIFYQEARFFSTQEVSSLLTQAGFIDLEYRQTLFTHPSRMEHPDPVQPGFGTGSFVVVRGIRPDA